MSWDKEPPKQSELASVRKESSSSWDSAPPSKEELQVVKVGPQAPARNESTGNAALDALAAAGRFVDRYTGAPVRSAIGAAQMGDNPFSAYLKQFGDEPEKAPTGEQIAKTAGLSDERRVSQTAEQKQKWDEKFNPGYAASMKQAGIKYEDSKYFSPAQAAGLAIDVAADPFLIAGAGKMLLKAPKVLSAAEKTKQVAKAFQKQSAEAGSEAVSRSAVKINGGDVNLEQSGEVFKYKTPQNLEELKTWKPPTNAGQLPGKKRLEEIVTTVPDLEVKPLKYHFDMMENPKAMKELKLRFENLPTEDAKRIAAYNQAMVDESARKINQTAYDLAGTEPKSLSDAGYDFIDHTKTRYNAEKEALGPVFQEIQKRSKSMNQTSSHDLIVALGENSKVGKLLTQDPQTGRFTLGKNTPRTGISDSEHTLISRVIDDLNDGMTFEEIQKTREFLRKAVDPQNPAATAEINKIRTIMLGQLEGMAGSLGDDVQKTFKAYAKNERARESVEQIIGGQIDSLDKMFAANPDKVVAKIFSNPNHTKIVTEYIGAEKMRELVQSFVANGIRKSTDSAKGFSHTQFKTWLKTNETFLKANVDPKVLSRLYALADYGFYGKRFLDEVNPSGTAAALKEMVEPGTFSQKVKQQGLTAAVKNEVGNRITTKISQRQATRTVNELMGDAPKPKLSERLRLPTGPNTLKSGSAAQKGSVGARYATEQKLLSSENQEEEQTTAASKSPKGEQKWANDGFEKLLEHATPEQKERLRAKRDELFKNKRRLLIHASDFKPGSRSMEKILQQIEREK